jgi:hypothetical protein
MRRMVKENLLKFDGTPLFPERIAYTVPTSSPTPKPQLYKAVTGYVREEFNRAEALENDKRAGTVGFALTILQRRLASSPEAIYQSLRRRRERLESRLRELECCSAAARARRSFPPRCPALDATTSMIWTKRPTTRSRPPRTDPRSGDRRPLDRRAAHRDRNAEGARGLALAVRRSGDRHQVARTRQSAWRDLHAGAIAPRRRTRGTLRRRPIPPPASPHQKLVIFTEHRDTLNYLEERITTLLGRREAVVMIHGGMGREERLKAQEAFKHDPEVQVLLATDAAGEGINLQRAHLMVNYDLPWNPNRLEQRFGRIHRIGQTEVCHLWNLVADETREGDVYRTLLEKLEQARQALGGQVFDVLGKLSSRAAAARTADRGHPLRRDARGQARLTTVLDMRSTATPAEPARRPRAGARRDGRQPRAAHPRGHGARRGAPPAAALHRVLLPQEAFRRWAARARQREPRRYEITHVPAPVRNRDRLIGIGEPVLPRYERIAFEKALVAPQGSRWRPSSAPATRCSTPSSTSRWSATATC